MLDRLKGPELVGSEIAISNSWQRHGRRHRDAADPDHDGQYSTGGDDVIHRPVPIQKQGDQPLYCREIAIPSVCLRLSLGNLLRCRPGAFVLAQTAPIVRDQRVRSSHDQRCPVPSTITGCDGAISGTATLRPGIGGGLRARAPPAQGYAHLQPGDDSVRARAIIEGSVRIAQSGSDGAQVVIRFIGPAEMFGTVALFTDKRYPADAITLAETLEASWSEEELSGLMAGYPQIAINVIRIIGKRLQEMQDRVRELATQRAERRVAHVVLRLARQAGHNTVDCMAIKFPLRPKDLADIAGTTLRTASRILTGWRKRDCCRAIASA